MSAESTFKILLAEDDKSNIREGVWQEDASDYFDPGSPRAGNAQ